MSINEIVSLEARDLSPAKAREVLDFIRFLKQRDERAFLDQSAEKSLKKLWDTPEEDEAWKDLQEATSSASSHGQIRGRSGKYVL
jgi:hypothetical protein